MLAGFPLPLQIQVKLAQTHILYFVADSPECVPWFLQIPVASSGGCHCVWAPSSTELSQFLSLIVFCLPSKFTFCSVQCWIQSSSANFTKNTHSHNTFTFINLSRLKFKWQGQFTSPKGHFEFEYWTLPLATGQPRLSHTPTALCPHHSLLYFSPQPSLLIALGS